MLQLKHTNRSEISFKKFEVQSGNSSYTDNKHQHLRFGLQSCLCFDTFRVNILTDQSNCFTTSLWSVSQVCCRPSENFLISVEQQISRQKYFKHWNWRCKLTFRLMAGISITSFLLFWSFSSTCWRSYMKVQCRSLTSYSNSETPPSPLLGLKTWTMWQQPDCLPCDSPSSPPHTALCYFLLCLDSLKKPHEHQYRSKRSLLIWMFNFSARSHSVGSFHSLMYELIKLNK